jgi:capsular exopolysaccharide synthesis family protein
MLGQRNSKPDKVVMQNALKTLAANIRFSSVDNPVHSLCIASSIPSEGKTTVSTGLGKAFAAGGATVLMVECDMHRRSLASTLGVHGRHGLYSVLSGHHTVQEAVVSAGTTNLYFLDAEPSIPNPADLLQSKRFHELVETLTGMYTYVIFDTPPVNTFIDASIVASIVDATILVVRQDYTHRDDVRASYTQLQQAGANVIGIVLNYADAEVSSKYYDYYHEKKDAGYSAVQGEQPSIVARPETAPKATAPAAAAARMPSYPQTVPAAKKAVPRLRPLPEQNVRPVQPQRSTSPDETTEFLQQAGYDPKPSSPYTVRRLRK